MVNPTNAQLLEPLKGVILYKLKYVNGLFKTCPFSSFLKITLTRKLAKLDLVSFTAETFEIYVYTEWRGHQAIVEVLRRFNANYDVTMWKKSKRGVFKDTSENTKAHTIFLHNTSP